MATKGQRRRNDAREPLLYEENIYDRPLPCCGCGIGWGSFMLGFVFPLSWYYGTYLFFTGHHANDLRERPGLAACAIAGVVSLVVLVVTAIALMATANG